jgi:hypothetical protein
MHAVRLLQPRSSSVAGLALQQPAGKKMLPSARYIYECQFKATGRSQMNGLRQLQGSKATLDPAGGSRLRHGLDDVRLHDPAHLGVEPWLFGLLVTCGSGLRNPDPMSFVIRATSRRQKGVVRV